MSDTKVEIQRSMNNNLTMVYLGKKVTLWFSYTTIVAFAVSGTGTFKSKNIWSPTTARHLKSIPAHVLEHDEFTRRLDVLITSLGTAADSLSVHLPEGV